MSMNLKEQILDILKEDYTDEINRIDKCQYLYFSNIAEKIAKGLKKRGIGANTGVHPDFRSCSKCLVFHEAPRHERCQSCKSFSNFISAEKVCSRCGSHIGGKS